MSKEHQAKSNIEVVYNHPYIFYIENKIKVIVQIGGRKKYRNMLGLKNQYK